MKVPLCCSDQNRPMVATTAATPCAGRSPEELNKLRDSTQSELVENLDTLQAQIAAGRSCWRSTKQPQQPPSLHEGMIPPAQLPLYRFEESQ
jgi:hypothetical protein